MQITKDDLEILARLEEDASVRRKELAARLGVSEATLSKRIGSLSAERFIRRFTIDIDYRKLGVRVNAITLIALEKQSEEAINRVLESLAHVPEAIEVATLLGEWDLYVRWMVSGPDQLVGSVRSLMGTVPVKRVETITLGEFSKQGRGADPRSLKENN